MLLRALLLSVALSSLALAQGIFGVRASYYSGALTVRAFVEQTLFSFAGTVDFVAGIELDEALQWQPYSGVNLNYSNIFAQFIWGPRGLALQVVYAW